jgi:hypothetical protein
MKKVIKDKVATKRAVDSRLATKALGAEDTGVKIDTRRGPLSLLTLGQSIVERLRSSGCRAKGE